MKNQRLINLNSWIRQHAEGRNLERTEVAKPPPQRTRKEDNDSRKRGGSAAAPAALKKEAALIKIAHDQSGRGRGNLLPSYSSWQPVRSAEDNGTSPQRGITSPVFAK